MASTRSSGLVKYHVATECDITKAPKLEMKFIVHSRANSMNHSFRLLDDEALAKEAAQHEVKLTEQFAFI